MLVEGNDFGLWGTGPGMRTVSRKYHRLLSIPVIKQSRHGPGRAYHQACGANVAAPVLLVH